MLPSGAPAAVAASANVRTASAQHSLAKGCGRQDDGIARHQRQQGFEEDSCHRIGDRHERKDHASWPWQFHDLAVGVDAWRNKILVAVQLNKPGRACFILHLLVGDNAHAGFTHGPLGIVLRLGMGGLGNRIGDPEDVA